VVAVESKNIHLQTEELLSFCITFTQTALELTEIVEFHSLMGLIHFDGENKEEFEETLTPSGQEVGPDASTDQPSEPTITPPPGVPTVPDPPSVPWYECESPEPTPTPIPIQTYTTHATRDCS